MWCCHLTYNFLINTGNQSLGTVYSDSWKSLYKSKTWTVCYTVSLCLCVPMFGQNTVTESSRQLHWKPPNLSACYVRISSDAMVLPSRRTARKSRQYSGCGRKVNQMVPTLAKQMPHQSDCSIYHKYLQLMQLTHFGLKPQKNHLTNFLHPRQENRQCKHKPDCSYKVIVSQDQRFHRYTRMAKWINPPLVALWLAQHV